MRGHGLKIPHTKIVPGRGHMSLNPISSQSLTVLFIIYLSPLVRIGQSCTRRHGRRHGPLLLQSTYSYSVNDTRAGTWVTRKFFSVAVSDFSEPSLCGPITAFTIVHDTIIVARSKCTKQRRSRAHTGIRCQILREDCAPLLRIEPSNERKSRCA